MIQDLDALVSAQRLFSTSELLPKLTVAAGETPGDSMAVMPRASNTSRIPAARPCGKGSLKLPSLCRQGGPQWRAMMPIVLPIPHGSPLPPTYYNCLLQPKMSPMAQPPSPQPYASPLSSLFLGLSISVCAPHIHRFQGSCMMVSF